MHGLRPGEAIEKTESALRMALERGQGSLRVIVGKGLHSVNGRAILKAVVQREMERFVFHWSVRFVLACSLLYSIKAKDTMPCRCKKYWRTDIVTSSLSAFLNALHSNYCVASVLSPLFVCLLLSLSESYYPNTSMYKRIPFILYTYQIGDDSPRTMDLYMYSLFAPGVI